MNINGEMFSELLERLDNLSALVSYQLHRFNQADLDQVDLDDLLTAFKKAQSAYIDDFVVDYLSEKLQNSKDADLNSETRKLRAARNYLHYCRKKGLI